MCWALLSAASIGAQVVAAEGPPLFVVSFRSTPGEPMDDFALRIKDSAIDHSMRLSGEVCGEFRRDGATLVLDLYSLRHLQRCSYRRFKDHAYTGLTYHTHIVVGITDQHRRTAKLLNPRFSEEDYSHPGYLATERKVLFQTGPGTERRLRRSPATIDTRSVGSAP